jgi:hypothetical protein
MIEHHSRMTATELAAGVASLEEDARALTANGHFADALEASKLRREYLRELARRGLPKLRVPRLRRCNGCDGRFERLRHGKYCSHCWEDFGR